MNVKLCLLLIVACMLSCIVDDSKNGTLNAQTQVQEKQIKEKVDYNIGDWTNRDLPQACSLIGKKYLASIFQMDAEEINVKDGNPSGIVSRSCYYRWDTPDLPNSGVLVMVSKNPQPEKVKSWASLTIQARIDTGDSDGEGGELIRYKPLTEIGTTGAYSHQMARYYWQVDDELLFMIAFNMNSHPDQQKAVALLIGERVMENFLKKTQ